MRSMAIYYAGFLKKAGGAFFHVRTMEAELRRTGWAVTVITLDDLPLWCRYLPHIVQVLVNVFCMPLGFLYKGLMARALFRRFFDTQADARVFEDIYIAWNSGVPSISVLHAVWSDNLQAYSVSQRRQQRLRAREAELVNRLEHPVLTVSHPYRRYIEEEHFAGRLRKRLNVVELGRDQSEFLKFAPQARDRKSIVYAGALEARKNVRFMLDVFERLSRADGEYRLTIIGDGPDLAALLDQCRRRRLAVVFLGKMRYEEVVAELHRHAVYLHTSVKESFSFSLLEAKLAGLKTCAYAGLQVPPEFIDVGLADFSVDTWCAGIRGIDWTAGASFQRERFTAERMARATLELIPGLPA